jgi:GAF domain-containing protein
LNKVKGDFSTDDLELLDLAAGMVAVAIKNSERYNEMMVSNEASRKFIQQINDSITSPERVDQARKNG